MAVYSMTGYASASAGSAAPGDAAGNAQSDTPRAPSAGGSVSIELRSVNSRFLDLVLRLPDEFRALEPALRDLVGSAFRRGKIELRLNAQIEAASAWPQPQPEQLNRLARLESTVQGWLPKAASLSVNEILQWCRSGTAAIRVLRRCRGGSAHDPGGGFGSGGPGDRGRSGGLVGPRLADVRHDGGWILHHDLHVHDVLHELVPDGRDELLEHLEAFTLPLGERVLLTHGTEADRVLQVIHLPQVVTPPLVDDAQHDLALDLAHRLRAELGLTLRVVPRGVGHEDLVDLVGRRTRTKLLDLNLGRPVGQDLGAETVGVPFLGEVAGAIGADGAVDGVGERPEGVLGQVHAVEHLVAPGVDHLALLVHDLVVLEHVLADLGVALLDGVLGSLDGLGDHAVLDRQILGPVLAHHHLDRAEIGRAHV